MAHEVDRLERRAKRERAARVEAEGLLEQKSRELFLVNRDLQASLDELRQATARSERLSERSRQIVEAIQSGLIHVDIDLMILHANRVAGELLGQPVCQEGANLPEQHDVFASSSIREALTRRIHTQGSETLPTAPYRRLDGTPGFLRIVLHSVVHADPDRNGVLILADDITEQLAAEAQAQQAQKLESIGQLAAGIAHEMNTPIQYIGDNTEFIQRSLSTFVEIVEAAQAWSSATDNAALVVQLQELAGNSKLDFLIEESTDSTQQTLDGVRRVAEIVRAMKAFSHPDSERTWVDLNESVRTAATLATSEWKQVAEVAYDLDSELPEVHGVAGDLNQVLLNLIVNAAHAIEEALEAEPSRLGKIDVRTCHEDGSVRVEVRDNGTGIPESILGKVFDPFFTTKEVGRGTGQGLSLAFNVIRDHGGEIRVDSSPGQGSTFIVCLPYDEAAVAHG